MGFKDQDIDSLSSNISEEDNYRLFIIWEFIDKSYRKTIIFSRV